MPSSSSVKDSPGARYGNGYATENSQLARPTNEKQVSDGNGMVRTNFRDPMPDNSKQKKPILHVSDEAGAFAAAKDIVSPQSGAPWFSKTPDALITFIAGNISYGQWRRDDYRSALQGGFIKLINTLNLGIFDDGLYYGISRMWGDVIREEEIQRQASGEAYGRLPLIGVVPSSRYNEGAVEYPHEDPVSIGSANAPPAKFPLDDYHPYHVVMENQSFHESSLLRVAFERRVLEELNRSRVEDPADPSRKSVDIPLVAFLFQGELDELDRITAYLEGKVPVIVMEGCGGMGDILASAINDSAELNGSRLRASVETQLQRTYPFLRENEYSLVDYLNSIMELLKLAFPEGQAPLMSIMNCRQLENFGDLQSFVLKSVISSSSAKASPILFEHFLTLAVKCNNADIAQNMLLAKLPWSNMELPASVFELAMLLPNCEKFVDIYLQHLFPIRKYLSHLKLLKLFREAKDRQFFPEHVWEGIMRCSMAEPVGVNFIVTELNQLIKHLTGVRYYINAYELSAAAFGETGNINTATEERRSMSALIVHAVLFNRPNMVKTLIKHHSDPLPQALFAESLFHGIYKRVSNVAISMGVKKNADDLAKVAVDIFDRGVQKSQLRGPVILTRRFPDFNNKTPLELAYDTNNKGFVAHGSVQNWLDQYYANFIKVKGNFDNLKLFLSAIFIFPMYFWLSFPKMRQASSTAAIDDPAKEGVFRPKTEQDAQRILAKIKRYQTGSGDADNAIVSQPRPPFTSMIQAVWSAPVVRFYTWHLFYWMFIILICVDIMLPPCRFIGVDIAVFVITISIWSDLVTRTLYDYQHYRRMSWMELSYDLISQTLFNILFFLYRIAPYRYDHPFAGRVILAFGILYYCYRVWSFFYYMEKTLGPVIRIIGQMFYSDLSRWLVLLAPFMIATTLIFQGVITPDWPMTGDDWRHAWYRGVFTIFAGFQNELEYTGQCEQARTKNLRAPWIHTDRTGRPDGVPADRCWTGEYDNYACPTVSFWSYFFVIQYFILLKLGLSNVLSAFYVVRQLQQASQAQLVWKYHRCRVVMDYANRTSMPPPFYALGYIYRLIKGHKGDPPLGGAGMVNKGASEDTLESDSFTFWKGVALDYFRTKDQEAEAPKVPQKQVKTLTDIQTNLSLLSKKLAAADRKVMEVEEFTKQTGMKALDAAQMRQNRPRNLSEVAQPYPHKLSRQSPYLGTNISRLSVPDDKIDWEDTLEDYRPEVFNKAAREFDGELPSVDSELDFRSFSTGSTRNQSGSDLRSLQGYRWNDVDRNGPEGPVMRRSWITTQDGEPVTYNVDSNGNPLNPFGRTGLRGRGSSPRFGPNHKVYLLITNPSSGGFRYIVQTPQGRGSALPQQSLGRHGSEYAVACLMLDAFLFDTATLNEKDLDVKNVTSMGAMSDVMKDILKGRLTKIMDNFGTKALQLREMYRGYLDSPQNTDNAWMEVVVFQLTVPSFGIDRFTTYKWNLYGSDSPLQDFDGAIVRQAYQQSTDDV